MLSPNAYDVPSEVGKSDFSIICVVPTHTAYWKHMDRENAQRECTPPFLQIDAEGINAYTENHSK